MKKVLLVLAAALFASAAGAQESGQYPSYAGFVTNGFWDNWELSVGGGFATTLSNGHNAGTFGDHTGYTLRLALTKWVHPVFGVRGVFEGGKLASIAPQMADKQKFPYLFTHIDGAVNFSNWVGGYRDDRVYYAEPYVGFGYLVTNFTDQSHADNGMGTRQAFAFAYGIVNRFRLSPAVDLDLELKGALAPARMSPSYGGRSYLHIVGATLGLTCRFNRRDWERKPVCPPFSAEELRNYQQAAAAARASLESANASLAAARSENARLAGELKTAQAAAAAAKNRPSASEYLDPSTVILYRIGTSALTAEEKVRLDLKADLIKNGPKDQIYTIEGHADPQTGTKAVNQRLSEQRAKAVYDYLVSQGVNPAQLRYEGMGDTHNQYKSPVANRVAIIK